MEIFLKEWWKIIKDKVKEYTFKVGLAGLMELSLMIWKVIKVYKSTISDGYTKEVF